MKRKILISIGLILSIASGIGQTTETPPVPTDTVKNGTSLERLAENVLQNYEGLYEPDSSEIDTTKTMHYWRITERTGERVSGNPDTTLTDYPNRTVTEGQSVSVAYLGNLGLPAESRIYFERPERTNFMFFDHYWPYTKSPDKYDFMGTKIPYANITYQTAGSRLNKEERFQGEFSINFGKSINVGFDVDYLYARGFYKSQSAKHLDWVFYGSYIADKHNLHVFINPADYSNAENGGILNDANIYSQQSRKKAADILVNFTDTWNHMKSNKYYLTYRYNLGFEKETNRTDREGNKIKQFIPVSSLIYTFDYTTKSRRFNSNDSINLNNLYNNVDYLGKGRIVNDSTSYRQIRNTVGLSLREGFSEWAKFDLTAFLTQDFRNYVLMDSTKIGSNFGNDEQSTYIGGEIAKRTGKILRYNAKGSFGVLGENIGDIDISGSLQTRIPIFNDTASITGTGFIKNLSPSFYERNYFSKYFKWNNDFQKISKQYLGGEINIPQTKTNFKLGVENITNYIYFKPNTDTTSGFNNGGPAQFGDIQVVAATLQQNLKLGAIHWDNQLVYQTSSQDNILPLPDLSIYSNLYLSFKFAKVLTIQLGANVHYFTEYYSPTYEPVIQQFRLQAPDKNTGEPVKVGNYPLVNAYVNCHLKQARFFIEFYNISSSFVNEPKYFSLPHYPINPQIFKLGLSFDLHN